MTNNEKTKKGLRRAFLREHLEKTQRKMTIASKILLRSKELHRVLKTEYELLDRELFETSPGITILPEKKAPGSRRAPEPPKTPLPDYENMTDDERRQMLAKLLELQKTQDREP